MPNSDDIRKLRDAGMSLYQAKRTLEKQELAEMISDLSEHYLIHGNTEDEEYHKKLMKILLSIHKFIE